ncbi:MULTISPECIES: hypothetical protein [Caproicibacterium]|uniref:Secreted protein n=1 Tax=Caproicibacterium argilliputei TaxID=3030016 RepID=A0AA97H2C1_9FIRM|nr:hypothetical protein [Caproicibacterium argilliputei]WOC33433.1 hypothetical protein PXC00_06095 [Caproicibacterium argilliputei]
MVIVLLVLTPALVGMAAAAAVDEVIDRRHCDKQRQRRAALRTAEARKARNRKEIIDLMEWRNE